MPTESDPPTTIGDILVSSRSLAEYRAMFTLTEDDLRRRILDCPGGTASFTAEVCAAGGDVTACDPVYGQHTTSELAAMAQRESDRGNRYCRSHADDYVWTFFQILTITPPHAVKPVVGSLTTTAHIPSATSQADSPDCRSTTKLSTWCCDSVSPTMASPLTFVASITSSKPVPTRCSCALGAPIRDDDLSGARKTFLASCGFPMVMFVRKPARRKERLRNHQ